MNGVRSINFVVLNILLIHRIELGLVVQALGRLGFVE